MNEEAKVYGNQSSRGNNETENKGSRGNESVTVAARRITRVPHNSSVFLIPKCDKRLLVCSPMHGIQIEGKNKRRG